MNNYRIELSEIKFLLQPELHAETLQQQQCKLKIRRALSELSSFLFLTFLPRFFLRFLPAQ
jgi:hypothetical protein